jgi:hypothetical protein
MLFRTSWLLKATTNTLIGKVGFCVRAILLHEKIDLRKRKQTRQNIG